MQERTCAGITPLGTFVITIFRKNAHISMKRVANVQMTTGVVVFRTPAGVITIAAVSLY